ncbi:class I SAM-dependent methyltransferase [Falsarthrobacter nasiphocae]|uniref:SAM-dependent methyltransferase n=1 Tax=Falsarthrobacter nasiphocae TaxID=189863 RepID=A0AAE4C7P4_9MICC|nr:class I SAM-dependent methyltransferase [Falsarthrobacter nasiphocae]MDR6892734.1 SAM-dependent methyltransferase [Falsarthrobacter nasiphocae]
MHHGPRVAPERRAELASAYAHGAGEYDLARPGYPAEIAGVCLSGLADTFGSLRVADVGAGTGIFTEQLRAVSDARGEAAEFVAVDISEAMLLRARDRGFPTRVASGEDTGLEAQSWHLVTYAQAWHWVDPVAAGVEAARLVRPKGRLALAWNQLDVTVPWVHRLSRIMRSGDVFYDPARPPRPGGRWRSPELTVARFSQRATPGQITELARTRSSWRTSSAAQRERTEANLSDYLRSELGFGEDDVLELPYISFVWTFVRSSRVD